MSEPAFHPHPTVCHSPTVTLKILLVQLFLLTIFYCAHVASASVDVDKQRSWGAAGLSDSLGGTNAFWSSINEFFNRLSGSEDLVSDDSNAEEDETVVPETSDGAVFSEREGPQPFSEYLVRKSLYSLDDTVNAQLFEYHEPSESLDRTLNREQLSKSNWGQSEKPKRHNGFEGPGQGNWMQEDMEFKQVSNTDKNSKVQGTRLESSITSPKDKKIPARAEKREMHLARGVKEQPSHNSGATREDTQIFSQGAASSLIEERNIPSDNSKKNYFQVNSKPLTETHEIALGESPNTERIARDSKHTEHVTSGLYTSGARRDGATKADNFGMYIASASPVAPPPWDHQWHSMKGTLAARSSPARMTQEIFSGSLHGVDASKNRGYEQYDGWHEGADDEQAGQSSSVSNHTLDYLDQDEGTWDDLGDHVPEPWPYHRRPALPGLNEETPLSRIESICGCWETDSKTPQDFPEVECSCVGPDITQVPTNLSRSVFRITLNGVGLEILRNDSFTPYRKNLHEIVLENVLQLHTIEAGAFMGLNQLRSIYIHTAPQLRNMPNFTFTANDRNLKSLRISNSGLERIPNMQFIGLNDISNMIDLDSNRIRKVHSNSLKVRVEQLSLNYNLIECVEKEAFAGSEIGTLSLKGNDQLKSLHPEAFQGIGSLRRLDLSETSITSLPTLGLTDLDFLYLEKTPSLKVFPSIYSFKSIKEAHLTYPYHCCAFQFPEQHDPKQYIRHQEFIRKMEELCSDLTTPNIPVMASTIRSRPRHAFPTYNAPMEEFPNHFVTSTITETIPEDSSGQSESDDRWESSLSRESGGVVSIPLPTSTMMARNAKRESYKLPVHSPDTSSDAASRYWKMRLESGSYSLFPVNAAHSRARHKGHHAHHARLKLALNPDYKGTGMFVTEHKLEDLISRSRRGEHSELVGLSDTGDVTRYNLLPTSQQDQRTAALMREPEKELIPYPEKRFHTDENSHTQQEDDESFTGGGAIGGYHTPYSGFGNFNYTSNRFHGLSIRKNNSSQSSGGHDPERLEYTPALDSGDDKTYGGITGQNNTQGFPIEDNGHQYSSEGFPKDGGFPVVPGKDEVSSKKKNAPDSGWHSSVPLPKNETHFFPCGNLSKDYHYVLCVPEPDAFNPCEDIMGNLALRVAVWLVVVTAVLGNLAVIIVLISSKFKMTVSKFLMVNLALADLCMGLYLLIIAVMDLHTIGVYFNHAIDWQNGPGCKVAGFLTVFASELSIFTLTVITSERWYAITYAIHLNKRLKLSMAVKIMVVGWTYSITMAALPLLGISSYSKTSICLPMETGNALALAYLISLLLVNGLAFFVITACYASMYCSISRHDATAPHSDLTVAKRMALLVFTDFACWAPIAFFGLTAVAGVPLINVTRAKILLVFFYPLNSCANPYLYAILTKQYRRDLFILLARYGFCTKRAMRYKGAYSSVNNTLPHNTVVNAPNHRNSTLTQITLCDLTRTARASQQSNNGSLLGTMIGGSQDSLQRNVSPLRTPTKPETVAGENERLSTVQEMSHSTHSDEDASDDHGHHDDRGRPNDQESPSGVVKLAGSPHPIKNCYTRMSFTPEQEEILKQALQESKVKKKARAEAGMKSSASQTLLADNGNPVTEDGKSFGHVMAENGRSPGLCAVDSKKSITQHLPEKAKSPCHEMIEHAKLFAHKIVESGKSSSHGEAFVICEVEINHGRNKKNLGKKNGLEEVEEATSTL